MSHPYSIEEVFEIAINIEKHGTDFYNKLAAHAEDEESKKLFVYLANEEKHHIDLFTGMRDRLGKKLSSSFLDYWGNEEMGLYLKELADVEVFPELDDMPKFLKKFDSKQDIIKYAIGMEKSNILFFMEVLEALGSEDETENKIVKDLINEEKKHILKLCILLKQ
ncbi:ferritin family protein [bacterium]|nr:ferritin family protein [bacterium]